MCSAQVSEPDRAAGLIPAWRVLALTVLPEHRLSVRFADGTEGVVDLSRVVWCADAGVFAALREPSRFAEACIQHGAIQWPGDIDLAPDAAYREIRAHGRWIVEKSLSRLEHPC